jgi:hypothetical protein
MIITDEGEGHAVQSEFDYVSKKGIHKTGKPGHCEQA